MRSKNILLIDDNPIDNIINKKLVEIGWKCENITVADSAHLALEHLSSKDSLTTDIIFLDIKMPEMDGFEFLDEYKKLGEHITSNCKIIMLSSSIDPRDEQRSKENPYVIRFISKPLNLNILKELEEVIQGH